VDKVIWRKPHRTSLAVGDGDSTSKSMFLGFLESPPETERRFVQPFWHNSAAWQTTDVLIIDRNSLHSCIRCGRIMGHLRDRLIGESIRCIEMKCRRVIQYRCDDTIQVWYWVIAVRRQTRVVTTPRVSTFTLITSQLPDVNVCRRGLESTAVRCEPGFNESFDYTYKGVARFKIKRKQHYPLYSSSLFPLFLFPKSSYRVSGRVL